MACFVGAGTGGFVGAAPPPCHFPPPCAPWMAEPPLCALQGAWALATGQAISLSEQALVDCSWKYGNNGGGGL